MEGFKETDIGWIPDDWAVVEIGHLFKFSSGKSRPKNTEKIRTDELRIPVYGGNGILGYTNQYLLNSVVLLLGRVGEYCGCSHLTEQKSWVSDNALYSKEIKKECDLIFIRACFEYLNLNQYSNKMGQPLITQGVIHKVQFALPPLLEQKTIARILSNIQQAIEKQQLLIDRTIELKKNLMHRLFTKGTEGEHQKKMEIGLVPKSWEIVKFEELGEIVYGIQASVANNFEPIGYKILTNKNITIDGRINLEKINYFELKTKKHFQTILRKGDLLFNWRSGSKEHVGKTAFFDLDDNFTHSSFILRIRVYEQFSSRFLYYYLNYLREIGYYIKVQTYVIVHELLHFNIPNHGKLWKSLMTAYLGDWKSLEDRLKEVPAVTGNLC